MRDIDYPLIGYLTHSLRGTLQLLILCYCSPYGKLEENDGIPSIITGTSGDVVQALSYMTRSLTLIFIISSLLRGCFSNFLLFTVLS